MTTTRWVLLTIGLTAVAMMIFEVASRLNARSTSLAARRRTGMMQLARWGVLAGGLTALAGELAKIVPLERAA